MYNVEDHERFALSFGALWRFLGDQRGATAIEYAIIAAGVAVAIAAAVTSLGSGVNALFTSVSTALK
jgi:pilus assembly protein Flp/PilA